MLALGVLDGLLVAIAFSIAMLLRTLASSALSELGASGEHDFVSFDALPRAARIPAGMLILRPEEPLFFANADRLLARRAHEVRRRNRTRES